ncbi:hypothetical protein PSPO01_15731 [Paraphaeosphaeria sporulosa]
MYQRVGLAALGLGSAMAGNVALLASNHRLWAAQERSRGGRVTVTGSAEARRARLANCASKLCHAQRYRFKTRTCCDKMERSFLDPSWNALACTPPATNFSTAFNPPQTALNGSSPISHVVPLNRRCVRRATLVPIDKVFDTTPRRWCRSRASLRHGNGWMPHRKPRARAERHPKGSEALSAVMVRGVACSAARSGADRRLFALGTLAPSPTIAGTRERDQTVD